VLALSMRLGRGRVEALGTQSVELAPVESPRPIAEAEPEPPAAAPEPAPAPAAEEDAARSLLESGREKLAAGDAAGAKADWKACLAADPENEDCAAALRRASRAGKHARRRKAASR